MQRRGNGLLGACVFLISALCGTVAGSEQFVAAHAQDALGPYGISPYGYRGRPLYERGHAPYGSFSYGAPWRYRRYGGVYEPWFDEYRFFPNVEGHDPRLDPYRHSAYPLQYHFLPTYPHEFDDWYYQRGLPGPWRYGNPW